MKIKNRMANSVDSDERAHHEPSHLFVHCLQKYLSWSTGLKGLNITLFSGKVIKHFRIISFVIFSL